MPPRELRADFPILAREVNGHPLTYLDNAATTQKPRAVIDALVRFYERHNANVHRGVHTLSEEATALYEGARATAAAFLGAASPREIVFTRGTTDALNLAALGWAAPRLRAGDEILLTQMEHHSNLVPWQLAARATGAVLRHVPVTADGVLDLAAFATLLTERTRIVALTHVSNVLGTVNPVAELTRQAHAAGAVVVLDSAQAVPKLPLDVRALDCDFLACSGHKVYGPTGIGLLYGKAALLEQMQPVHGGGGMIRTVEPDSATWMEPPWRFEPGTPPVADAVGLGAALDYLSALDRPALLRQEAALTAQAIQALHGVKGVTCYGPPAESPRAGVVSFNLAGAHPHDVAEVLDQVGVAVRAGHHCCQPLMSRWGVNAMVRASFALYNGPQDVERLIAGLERARAVLLP